MKPLDSVSVGRRRFLLFVGSLAAAAGTGQLLADGALAGRGPGNQTVYFLDPEWGAGDPACPLRPHWGPRSCHACIACHSHDVNKLFISGALANSRRAHPNCKCLVGSRRVNDWVFVMIFGPPSGPLHRDEFDRRRDRLFLPPRVLPRV